LSFESAAAADLFAVSSINSSSFFLGLCLLAGPVILAARDDPIQPVPFTAVRITGGF